MQTAFGEKVLKEWTRKKFAGHTEIFATFSGLMIADANRWSVFEVKLMFTKIKVCYWMAVIEIWLI